MDGFYSLEIDAMCMPCMDNANCPGGSEINVTEGYWWDKMDRKEIVKCYELEACKGGYYPEEEFPVACGEGYWGYLC